MTRKVSQSLFNVFKVGPGAAVESTTPRAVEEDAQLTCDLSKTLVIFTGPHCRNQVQIHLHKAFGSRTRSFGKTAAQNPRHRCGK